MHGPYPDVTLQWERRTRRARNALLFGGACVGTALVGSYVAGAATPQSTLSALSIANLLALFAAPVAFAIAAANLTSSDNALKRVAYALFAAVISFTLLVYVAFDAWTRGGGHLHF